ncbi:DUF6787 family protein [Algivirga pacifica]|uniref:DUF6787 domain-containing protein n=1 Tax=Algivirga pacifica TaxID=1162670 RepID=A0ABP9DK03_9BACT
MSRLSKLQAKWGVNSIWQVIAILVAFSLAGSSVVVLRKAFFELLGFTDDTSMWVKTVTYILFVFPAYQLLLLMYGTLLGQFRFFWEKEKKMLKGIQKLWTRS